MRRETAGDVNVEAPFAAGQDMKELLQATIEALGKMDVAALEALSLRAEAIVGMRLRVDAVDANEAIRLKTALGDLLSSTERSLSMLRGLREARVRRLEEGMAWAA
jgi:hypothetical protein